MADQTPIEWTDATWNIVTGCSVVSPGCTNCYAMRLAGTRLQHHPSRAGLTVASKAGPVWNGQVRFNADWLTQPLRWTKPRRIFVAAHGDLFHDGVTDDQRDQIFAVMALCPQHTFQILTKRPERMRAYLSDETRTGHAGVKARIRSAAEALGREAILYGRWPLPNVWLGVSTEDQVRADQRIPVLLDTPAAIRWISAEPLLGLVDLTPWLWTTVIKPASCGRTEIIGTLSGIRPSLDWVVVGGERGPDARPMHPDWARRLRDQCAAAGVPFFFKQWGEWAPVCALTEDQINALYHPRPARDPEGARRCRVARHTLQRDGSRHDFADPAAWQQGTGPMLMLETGKKAAGRLLDGVLHDGFPEARS